MKCLDPNQPQIRDSLQQIVTINFAELVKTYPNVAFHHASQKLAVGTVEGTGIVYDVRIAARVQMLEVRIQTGMSMLVGTIVGEPARGS